MIGVSAANANILVIVNATRLLRSQLVEQVRTMGATVDWPLLWMTSMQFCEMPRILFTELFLRKKMFQLNDFPYFLPKMVMEFIIQITYDLIGHDFACKITISCISFESGDVTLTARSMVCDKSCCVNTVTV